MDVDIELATRDKNLMIFCYDAKDDSYSIRESVHVCTCTTLPHKRKDIMLYTSSDHSTIFIVNITLVCIHFVCAGFTDADTAIVLIGNCSYYHDNCIPLLPMSIELIVCH